MATEKIYTKYTVAQGANWDKIARELLKAQYPKGGYTDEDVATYIEKLKGINTYKKEGNKDVWAPNVPREMIKGTSVGVGKDGGLRADGTIFYLPYEKQEFVPEFRDEDQALPNGSYWNLMYEDDAMKIPTSEPRGLISSIRLPSTRFLSTSNQRRTIFF